MRHSGQILLIAIAALAATAIHGQTRPETLAGVLAQPVQSPDVTAFQLQQYLSRRIPLLAFPKAPTSGQNGSSNCAGTS